ncbi:sulfite exporter TauE/SafE family protein [Corynebacterium guangdongense]|uniref:Probable membrane transporter protein n=1 Tax=Corynebacterium guangdongense TaxID=1783348 RepID=A0ABU1ZZN4_9CORY|nr:sulfite exporter TauE/SafE family protein [Corynebacterium guangdongense]MDR7330391.1 putative membrane protein YfcA [Corynebacterium guangdongense]WJZ18949.1 Sulfite exporter TauE/SafE [Corynebacterium guangdongense]
MRTLILIALAGLAAQLVDGGLGMGFGVTSTTMLITLAALTPAAASAVVHTAEVGTTLVSGFSHWRFGNVHWPTVARIGVPGAVGAFAGATFLSSISTASARPVTTAILSVIGIVLVIRFSRGRVRREVAAKQHSTPFYGVLGLFGGFIDASGGGGWGPVTTSTLLAAGRNEPRRIIGTVNTAEFLVSAAATAGFAIGLWDDLIANLAAVLALLIGGALGAPIAAWAVSRINAVALGGVVGTMIVFINLPTVLTELGVTGVWMTIARALILLVGLGAALLGVLRARRNAVAEVVPASVTVAPHRSEAETVAEAEAEAEARPESAVETGSGGRSLR